MKNFYTEKHKTLIQMEEATSQSNNISCLWIRKINIVIMSKLPKEIYIFNIIAIHNTNDFLQRNSKSNIKLQNIKYKI
jgi:hypothetical protein